jgi:hypothetical protein
MMSIREELVDEIARYEKMGRRNYTVSYLLSAAAVLTSFFAGLSVALDWFGKDILAVLSAFPAAVLIASDRFQFGERTKWAYGKAFALKGILSALDYEDLSAADASRNRSKINADYEERWPGIAKPPK